MRRGWIIAIALIACVGILTGIVFLAGNNGVQTVSWNQFAPMDMQRPDGDELVFAAQGQLSEENCERLDSYEGRQDVVRLSAGGTVSCVVNAPQTAVYALRVGYHTENGKGVDMEYSLQII